MDNLFHIFKISLEDARKIAESSDRVHIPDHANLPMQKSDNFNPMVTKCELMYNESVRIG